MKHLFLGMAANYEDGEWLRHLFTRGARRDLARLKEYLSKRYDGKAILCKNGRSALTLMLEAYFEPGDSILVNGFTCYAVYEAIKAAKMKPVFVDISKDTLNFTTETLNEAFSNNSSARGIIIQNTLGNPVDILAVEEFAKRNNLTIIEDLAHSAGVRYSDGREAGTVGIAAICSFGKEKSIDTISGGAAIMRRPCKHAIKAPSKVPKLSDHLRARFYPMFGATSRMLSYVKMGGAFMRLLVKVHWVERSADNRLDTTRRPSKFQAKLALEQFEKLRRHGEPPIREFCFVENRVALLKELRKKGYFFDGFWYEKPVSPARYYQKVHFPEEACPNAVFVAEHIINLPNYYTRRDLRPALKLIKTYKMEAIK